MSRIEEVKKEFEEMDFTKLKNAEIIETVNNDRVLAILKIRDEEYKLLDYDWYMLTAIKMTDSMSNIIDFDFVVNFRIAIREDFQKWNGSLMETFEYYEYYNIAAIDKYIESYDNYLDSLEDENFVDFTKWIYEQCHNIERELEKIPENIKASK